jgi:S-adenosylmethionine:tRNA ribosyltransferase-isomerase
VAGSDAKLAVARRLGAVAGVNYKDAPAFSAAVASAAPGGAQLILDPVGASFCAENAASLALDGRWVLYGSMGGLALPEGSTLLAQVRASKSPKPGMRLRLCDAFEVEVGARASAFFVLHFPTDALTLIEQFGSLPLPPYITHAADEVDAQRYQTVYAKSPGAVAAPTAGLHFDQPLLDTLQAKGVRLAWLTLHVGAGTFQPVRTEDLTQHNMHSEWYNISSDCVETIRQAQQAGRDIIAVGTTSLRALESASRSGQLLAGSDDTEIFITPGFSFQTVTRLITNFHLPKSTLMMLVSAFAGYEHIRSAYAHAIEQRYRFFSYGDAMLLDREGAR